MPQKLSKRILSCPFNQRTVTFDPRIPPGISETWILKPKDGSSATSDFILSGCVLDCRRAARDQTALSANPTPVEILGFHIHLITS